MREAREVFEREYLLAQINRFGGNISRTAEFVGMERSALHRKLKALGIDDPARGGADGDPDGSVIRWLPAGALARQISDRGNEA